MRCWVLLLTFDILWMCFNLGLLAISCIHHKPLWMMAINGAGALVCAAAALLSIDSIRRHRRRYLDHI